MNIHNHLPFVVDVRSVHDEDGYELASLMVKATFRIPRPGEGACEVSSDQVPWAVSDTLAGPQDQPVTVYEAESPYTKPHPEFIVVGHAHSPTGAPVPHIEAGIRVGRIDKRLVARGPRQWQSGWLRSHAGPTAAVEAVPLTYGQSFGGMDPTRPPDHAKAWHEPNPVGTGYCASPGNQRADGLPLPQLEPLGRPFKQPCRQFPVIALGCVARHALQRASWSGTYDESWQASRWPALPLDFDARFHQSASPDQWLDGLQGGDEVVLTHLSAARGPLGPQVHFRLPELDFHATLHPRKGASTSVQLRADTVVFEPDAERFFVIARRLVPLQEGLHELEAVAFGTPSDREQLAPIVPTFIDLDEFRELLRRKRPSVVPPIGHRERS